MHDPWIGRHLGPYEIRHRLGSGGSGAVYAAWDARLQREVALKLVSPAPGAPADALDRFRREAVLAARLSHPAIVPIYDVGEVVEPLPTAYLAMRRLPGRTLADLIAAHGPLPLDEAVRLALALAEALDYAHRQGVIHRDIKPANVLLDEEGRPLLADFGIARALEEAQGSAGPTLTGTTAGTPTYMSPEQAAGQPLDARSDLYSLGVLLYEMVAGRPPFAGPPPVVMRAHLDQMVPPVQQFRPEVSPALAQVVMKSLAKAPRSRFATGAALAEALRAAAPPAAAPLPTPASEAPTRRLPRVLPAVVPPTEPPRAARPPTPRPARGPLATDGPQRRQWVPLLLLTLLLLCLGGGIGAGAVLWGAQGWRGQATPTVHSLLLAGSPTATASATPTEMLPPTPSATLIPTLTGAPATETPLPSATLPPSATSTQQPPASETPPPSATPPPTATPTEAPSVTPLPTPSATALAGGDCPITIAPEFATLWQPSAGCPSSAPIERGGAIQIFEFGLMFWRDDMDVVFVLFETLGDWGRYTDPWQEGDPDFSCPEAEALGMPKRGFGKVWCANLEVRQRVGEPRTEEKATAFLIQPTETGAVMINVADEPVRYLLFPTGRYRSARGAIVP